MNDLELAKELAHTCVDLYMDQATGLGPESVRFHEEERKVIYFIILHYVYFKFDRFVCVEEEHYLLFSFSFSFFFLFSFSFFFFFLFFSFFLFCFLFFSLVGWLVHS